MGWRGTGEVRRGSKGACQQQTLEKVPEKGILGQIHNTCTCMDRGFPLIFIFCYFLIGHKEILQSL